MNLYIKEGLIIYLVHGFIDIFNHETNHNNSKKLKLVTKTNEIVLEENGQYNYNSELFLNKILDLIVLELKNKDNNYEQIQIKKSFLNFSPNNQPKSSDNFHEYALKFIAQPFEDSAYITFDEFNIIASFNNKISFIKKEYIKSKKYIFDETQTKLIQLSSHSIQVSLKNCKNYDTFKTTMINAIYNNLIYLIVKETEKLTLQRWNIPLKEESLDIKNAIKDTFKILVA